MGVPELITRMQELYRQAEAQLPHIGPLETSSAAWTATAQGLDETAGLLRRTSARTTQGWPDEAGALYAERLGRSAGTVRKWQDTLTAADLPATVTTLAEAIRTTVAGVRELWNTFVQAVGQLGVAGIDAAGVEAALLGLVEQAVALLERLDQVFAEAAARVAGAADGAAWDGPAGSGPGLAGAAAGAAIGAAGGAAGAAGGAAGAAADAGAGGGARVGAGALGAVAGGGGGSPALAGAGEVPAPAGAGGGAVPSPGGSVAPTPVGARGVPSLAGVAPSPAGVGGVPAPSPAGIGGIPAPSPAGSGVPGVPPIGAVTPSPPAGVPPFSALSGGGGGGGGRGVSPVGVPAAGGAAAGGAASAGDRIMRAGRLITGAAPLAGGSMPGAAGASAPGGGGAAGGSSRFFPPVGGLGHGGGRGEGDIKPGDEESTHRDRPLPAVPGVPPSLRGRSGVLDTTPDFLTGDRREEPEPAEPLREELWETHRPADPFAGGR